MLNARSALTMLAALMLGVSAQAQMTIYRPGQPTPAQASPSSTASIPTGWNELRGRIVTPGGAFLPAGSQVSVVIEDVSLMDAPSRQLVKIQFGAARLPVEYQVVYNPVRFSPGRTYAVRATVTGPTGRLLYVTDTRTELPKGSRAVLNVPVVKVR